MIIDIVKLFTEESSRLLKAAFVLVKLCLAMVFAAWLFEEISGPYSLINPFDLSVLFRFVKEGTLFICLFYLLLSYLTLFQILPILIFIPFTFLRSGINQHLHINREEGKLLNRLLRMLDMVDISRKGNRIRLLNRANDLYEMAALFSNKEAKPVFEDLKKSFIVELLNTYLVFSLAYFLMFPSGIKSAILNTLVITMGCLLIFAYYSLIIFIDLFSKSSAKVISIIDDARLEEQAIDQLRTHGLFVHESPDDAKYYDWQFRYDAREIVIKYASLQHPMKEPVMQRLIEKAKAANQTLLIISRNAITTNAKQLADAHSNQVHYLKISSSEDLKEQLTGILTNNFAAID
jgi:hypothetical protein